MSISFLFKEEIFATAPTGKLDPSMLVLMLQELTFLIETLRTHPTRVKILAGMFCHVFVIVTLVLETCPALIAPKFKLPQVAGHVRVITNLG